MKTDLTCPVELWQYKLPEKDFPYCYFLMYNLSENIVISIQITLIMYNEKNEETIRLVERIHGLFGKPKNNFEIKINLEYFALKRDMEIIVEKVWFEDGMIWRRDKSKLVEYTSNILPNGRKLEMLKFFAGSDAVGYPSDQGPVWLCVCGRANAASDENCRRCLREKTKIFINYNENTIEKLVKEEEERLNEISKKARREASERQLDREKKRQINIKRKRRKVLVASIIGAILILSGGTYYYGIPYYNYIKSQKHLEQGFYPEAIEMFGKLGNFFDSKNMFLESKYIYAENLLNQNTAESIESSIQIFTEIKEYKQSKEKIKESKYAYAEKLFEAEEYILAADAFKEIENFNDSKQREKDARFNQGLNLLSDKEFLEAYEIFKELSDYPLINEYIENSLYGHAMHLVNQKKFEEAIEKLSHLSDSSKAISKIRDIYYLLASELKEGELFEQAAYYFLKCGNFKNAPSEAKNCIYKAALKYYENKDFEEAVSLLKQIDYDPEAKEELKRITYIMALEEEKEGNFEKAYEKFQSILGYEDSELKAEESFLKHVDELLNEGKEEEAIEKLTEAENYDNKIDRILNSRLYEIALQHFEDEDYTKALGAFVNLGDFEDSLEYVIKSKLAIGDAAFKQENYEQAIEVLEDLDDIETAKETLNKAKFQLALKKIDEGFYFEGLNLANRVLPDLGDDEELKIKEIQYEYANEKMNSGQYEQALETFANLGDYKEALIKSQQCYYAIGDIAQGQGDLTMAANMFAKAGSYDDAHDRKETIYTEYYLEILLTTKELYEENEYLEIIAALENIDLDEIPSDFKELKDYFNQSNYIIANQLYNEGYPYEALKYYREILDYKDVSSNKLKRNAYLIIGTWESDSGLIMEFKEDGTYKIEEEEGIYFVKQYAMQMGKEPENMVLTYKVTRLVGDNLTLRYVKDGKNIVYKLKRLANAVTKGIFDE